MKLCAIAECDRQGIKRGMCQRHYAIERRRGLLTLPMAPRHCLTNGCERPCRANGFCTTCGSRERMKNPIHKATKRLGNRVWVYNITVADFTRMWERCGGLCEACGGAMQPTGTGGVCIDHCHETGKVRGLLHAQCNSALGLLDESEIKIQGLLNYVRKHK